MHKNKKIPDGSRGHTKRGEATWAANHAPLIFIDAIFSTDRWFGCPYLDAQYAPSAPELLAHFGLNLL